MKTCDQSFTNCDDLVGGCPTTGSEQPHDEWAWLLGRWGNAEVGGEIEFNLSDDGTVMAVVTEASNLMKSNGYEVGMVVMRGWVRSCRASNFYAGCAQDGEYLIAAIPDREPDRFRGAAEWQSRGALLLKAKPPQRLDLPSPIAGTLFGHRTLARTN